MAVSVKENRIKYTIEVNKGGFLQVASETGKLKFAFKDLEQAMKAVSADIERQTQAHGRTAQVIDTEIQAMQKLAYLYANSPEQYELVQKKIAALTQEHQKLTGVANASAAAMGNNVSNAGLAGATLTELNRTISDANYGFTAVANNLSQLTTLFITLQSKTKESALGMGKFGGTLKALGRQLNGPLGIILAFQVIITLYERYVKKSKEAKDATADFNVELQANIVNVNRLIQMYSGANAETEERIQMLKLVSGLEDDIVEAAERGLITDEEIKQALEARLLLLEKKKQLDDEDKKLQKDVVDKLTERAKAEEELSKLQTRRSEIQAIAEEDRDTGQKNFMANVENAIKHFEDLIDTTNQEIDNMITEDRNPLVMQLAKAEVALDDISEKSQQVIKEVDDANKQSAANRKEVADFIKDLDEEVAMSTIETEDAKLRYVRNKEVERLESIGATDEQIATVKELYNNLIAQATAERIQKELDAETKKANKLAALERKVLDEKNKDNKSYLEQRILEIEILLRMVQMDAETRANLELELHNYRMKLKGIEAKADADAAKQAKKDLDLELELLQQRVDGLREMFSATNNLMTELSNITQNRYEREINLIDNQRDLIRSNDQLTKEEKEKQLTELQRKENKYREAQIKAERDFFIVKQTMAVAEMVMNGQAAVQRLTLLGVESVTSAKTSVGKFMAALGPFGVPAFALTIGGVIASIISATSKAKQEIAGLTNAPVSLGGMSSSAPQIQAPDFNVVGASGVNQLAAAISGRETKPIRAYVVSDDVSSAQEMDRKIVEGASI